MWGYTNHRLDTGEEVLAPGIWNIFKEWWCGDNTGHEAEFQPKTETQPRITCDDRTAY